MNKLSFTNIWKLKISNIGDNGTYEIPIKVTDCQNFSNLIIYDENYNQIPRKIYAETYTSGLVVFLLQISANESKNIYIGYDNETEKLSLPYTISFMESYDFGITSINEDLWDLSKSKATTLEITNQKLILSKGWLTPKNPPTTNYKIILECENWEYGNDSRIGFTCTTGTPGADPQFAYWTYYKRIYGAGGFWTSSEQIRFPCKIIFNVINNNGNILFTKNGGIGSANTLSGQPYIHSGTFQNNTLYINKIYIIQKYPNIIKQIKTEHFQIGDNYV